MIVKLTKAGGIVRHLDADNVYQQPTDGGLVDLEVSKLGGQSLRFLIGDDNGKIIDPPVWHRAYLMENGKTVDTIKGNVLPAAIQVQSGDSIVFDVHGNPSVSAACKSRGLGT